MLLKAKMNNGIYSQFKTMDSPLVLRRIYYRKFLNNPLRVRKYSEPLIQAHFTINMETACLLAEMYARIAIRHNAAREGKGIASDIEKTLYPYYDKTPSVNAEDIIQECVKNVCELFIEPLNIKSQSTAVNNVIANVNAGSEIGNNEIKIISCWSANNLLHKQRKPKYNRISIEFLTDNGVEILDRKQALEQITSDDIQASIKAFLKSLDNEQQAILIDYTNKVPIRTTAPKINKSKSYVQKKQKQIFDLALDFFKYDDILNIQNYFKALDDAQSQYITKQATKKYDNSPIITRVDVNYIK